MFPFSRARSEAYGVRRSGLADSHFSKSRLSVVGLMTVEISNFSKALVYKRGPIGESKERDDQKSLKYRRGAMSLE